jgi:hypothetical protein
MNRAAFAAALASLVLLAGACQFDPAGRCDSRADCGYGLDCLQGVCAACRWSSDCSSWQSCQEGLCEPLAGRCDADRDCASWDRCTADHRCTLRADHCGAANPLCVAPYTCDPEHHCSLTPPACIADSDCFAWMDRCDAGSCVFPATVGADVLAWGTLVEGRDDRSAVARPETPIRLELGFDPGAGADGRGFVDPVSGAVVYRHVGDLGGDTLRRFLRDPYTTAPIVYPADPSADDAVAIPTDACPATWGPWVMQADSGSLLYGCPIPGGVVWQLRDLDGVARFPPVGEPLAWSAAGNLLALDGGGIPRVYDSGGAGGAVAITNLPAGASVVAQRTSALGFLVALRSGAPAAEELWEIDEGARSAALIGSFDPLAAGYGTVGRAVLDADGTMYVRAFVGLDEVILKRPPAAPASVIYDELGGGLLLLDARSFLLTRP